MENLSYLTLQLTLLLVVCILTDGHNNRMETRNARKNGAALYSKKLYRYLMLWRKSQTFSHIFVRFALPF
jgi:hypothetical protein